MHLSAKWLPLAVALLELFGVTDKSTTTDLIGKYCPERSRPTTQPGGCDCQNCGCVFIGAPDDGLCRVCYEEWKSHPVRIQLSRTKGWKMPPNTVKVDRSTKWGNPFVPGKSGGVYSAKVKDRRHAYLLFRSIASLTPALVADARKELRGKNLACWCPNDDPYEDICHAAVLLEIANAPA